MVDSRTTITPAAAYPDTPLTNFPVSEDTWNRMSDVNLVLMPLVTQYNQLYNAGNLTACSKLIEDNPGLLDCFFNADKWNKLRDAVIALERYYLEEVTVFIERVAQNALGISDTPTEEQQRTVSYSAGKVNDLLADLRSTVEANATAAREVRAVTFTAAGWSADAPYTQTVSVEGVASTQRPVCSLYCPPDCDAAQEKAIKKAFGFVSYIDTGDGAVTAACIGKKPAVDFTVHMKGV